MKKPAKKKKSVITSKKNQFGKVEIFKDGKKIIVQG